VPRGKLLGGSSSINGMVFVRGQAQDFDTWAQMGNRGWSYTEVLPFFKRMESYAGEGDDGFRGREGPLRVTNPEPRDPLFATIIKARDRAMTSLRASATIIVLRVPIRLSAGPSSKH
jgi:choline dehydrogenase